MARMSGSAKRNVTVIGAGPAGMMAAIAAAAAGAQVTLCERQAKPGRKLAASGGGRCNLTNRLDAETFMRRFGPQGRFLSHALRRFGRDELLRHLQEWGVPCAAEDGFHYFPASQRATDVLQALTQRLTQLGVHIRASTTARDLEIEGGRVRGVTTDGETLPSDAVILAAGGAAWPALGGCSLGYGLAKRAGHAIVDPVPALVGLKTRETWPTQCSGVTLPDARAWIDQPEFRKRGTAGILLFTHAGLSGPLILDLSGDVNALLRTMPAVPLRISLTPGVAPAEWRGRMEQWRIRRGTKSVRNLLAECLPRSLAGALAQACGIGPELAAARITAQARDRLIEGLSAAPLTVAGSGGMRQAMVTRGGVCLKEVSPADLQSRLVKGLYFAGEVLDLDGPCGGYNLQWAFSSGWLAGAAAAEGQPP